MYLSYVEHVLLTIWCRNLQLSFVQGHLYLVVKSVPRMYKSERTHCVSVAKIYRAALH